MKLLQVAMVQGRIPFIARSLLRLTLRGRIEEPAQQVTIAKEMPHNGLTACL